MLKYKTEKLKDESYHFKFLNQELFLLPQKAIFWANQDLLLVSDVHLGKAGHFRRSGIAIPSHLHNIDLQHLQSIIEQYKVKKLVFLGDLFHSSYNDEWETFIEWLGSLSKLETHLVKGNHDILPHSFYVNSSIILHENYWVNEPFIFSHIPIIKEKIKGNLYNIAGHIHPAIKLTGKGRQAISLPCFYFGLQQAILPAFGIFTGKFIINPEEYSKIFAIVENKIISI